MKARILLVEDNKAQARHGIDMLEAAGYDVAWAMDGKTALKMALEGGFDIMLLDLVLPDMHGTQICRWVKGNEATRNIEIIILTARESMEEKVSGLGAGADDYLQKPYSDLELKARIEACMRTKALQDELAEKNRQLEKLLSEVQTMAVTDHLTGLYNRRHFTGLLDREFQSIRRYKQPLACLMVDVDHFKKINDTYGHHAGDAVLVGVARTLENTVRNVDLLARWGGEEFIVLLPHTKRKEALIVAGKILKNIRAAKFKEIGNGGVTVSIGCSAYPETDMLTPDMVVDTADNALYQAKEKGRDRAEAFE